MAVLASREDALDGSGMPAPAALGLTAFGGEGAGDGADAQPGLLERGDPGDGRDLVGDVFAGAAAARVEGFAATPAEGLGAEADAIGAELGEGIAGALGGGLALPLADGAEDVEDEPAGGGARVDGVGEGEEGETGGEVAVDELAEVADGAHEAIELHDNETGGPALVEHREGGLEAG